MSTVHRPFVSEKTEMKEFTLRAVLLGLVMSVVLGAAKLGKTRLIDNLEI